MYMKNTGINKLHVLAILTLLLSFTASADVNVRDRTNIFGNLNMQGDDSNIDMNTNNIDRLDAVDCNTDTDITDDDDTCLIKSDLYLGGSNKLENVQELQTGLINNPDADINMNSSLDLEGNDIKNVGSFSMDGEDLNLNGESIKNIGNMTGSGTQIDVDSNIDMNNNNIKNLDSFTDHISMSGHNITNVGDVTGAQKNFIQSINSTHEAKYTSQESPLPRAVYEEDDLVVTDGDATIELPNHFDQVSSSESPQIITHVTPDTPVAVGVVEESTEAIKIEAATDEKFRADLTVKAVRESYEDAVTVRKKQ
jgi:hypothetical protein